jgi:hypothetical protein
MGGLADLAANELALRFGTVSEMTIGDRYDHCANTGDKG